MIKTFDHFTHQLLILFFRLEKSPM